MYKAEVNIAKKDYIRCSLFYIKKYVSLREFVLLAVLFVLGLLFWLQLESIIIFVFFCVALLLMGAVILLFIITAFAGYNLEYRKRSIEKHVFSFGGDGFTVDSYSAAGDKVFTENFAFQTLDKVSFRKDRLYIYGGVATHFYILPQQMTDGDYEGLRQYLAEKVDPLKFRMKTKYRQFPFYSKKKFDQDLRDKLERGERGDE